MFYIQTKRNSYHLFNKVPAQEYFNNKKEGYIHNISNVQNNNNTSCDKILQLKKKVAFVYLLFHKKSRPL